MLPGLAVLWTRHGHGYRTASVIGVRFTAEVVADGLQQGLDDVDVPCEELTCQGPCLDALSLVAWPDGMYSGESQLRHVC